MKKPISILLIAAITALAACVALTVFFMTSPASGNDPSGTRETADSQSAASESLADESEAPLQSPPATEWFDYRGTGNLPWGETEEITLDEFPGVTFRCDFDKLEAVTDGETVTVSEGMPILNAYFCDINGDGKPEICTTAKNGSGMIDSSVEVFDYANGVGGLYLRDPARTDYELVLRDGCLTVLQFPWRERDSLSDEDAADAGKFMFRDGKYQVVWSSGDAVTPDESNE